MVQTGIALQLILYLSTKPTTLKKSWHHFHIYYQQDLLCRGLNYSYILVETNRISTQNFTMLGGSTAVVTFNSMLQAVARVKYARLKRKPSVIANTISFSNSLINQSTIHFAFNLGTMSK